MKIYSITIFGQRLLGKWLTLHIGHHKTVDDLIPIKKNYFKRNWR